MKADYDFSQGERGKFYHPDAVFHVQVYLEPDVDRFMSQLAEEKGLEIQKLVHPLKAGHLIYNETCHAKRERSLTLCVTCKWLSRLKLVARNSIKLIQSIQPQAMQEARS